METEVEGITETMTEDIQAFPAFVESDRLADHVRPDSIGLARRLTDAEKSNFNTEFWGSPDNQLVVVNGQELLHPDDSRTCRRSFRADENASLTAAITAAQGDRRPDGWSHGDSVWFIGLDESNAIVTAHRAACDAYHQGIADAESAKERDRAEITALARTTGKDQILSSWVEECNDPRDEGCDTDSVYLMVRPNGSTYTSRQHWN